ncbi:uncharacterized protein LOC108090668 [Drosophila ficusphila]|uniref:uncharacterized protein LOC108090668 n=1 Tax=Drosophila ficusphila TaxID=30025 RepID=UPI0007E80F86|nr:uncharacterized protein LOC108090668 [Drosophila ficusphila]
MEATTSLSFIDDDEEIDLIFNGTVLAPGTTTFEPYKSIGLWGLLFIFLVILGIIAICLTCMALLVIFGCMKSFLCFRCRRGEDFMERDP